MSSLEKKYIFFHGRGVRSKREKCHAFFKSSLNRLELNISDKPESKSQVQAQSKIDSRQVGHDGYVGHVSPDVILLTLF